MRLQILFLFTLFFYGYITRERQEKVCKSPEVLFGSSQQLPRHCLRPLKGFFSWHGALQVPSTCLDSCLASRTTENQGHRRQGWPARYRGPRTLSRTNDANLDCACVEKPALLLVVSTKAGSWGPRLPPPPCCDKEIVITKKLWPVSRVHSNYSKSFRCTWCKAVFYDDATLKEHVATHDKDVAKAKICKPCDRRWVSPPF